MSKPVRLLGGVIVAAVLAVTALIVVRWIHDDSRRQYLDATNWPANGQAAYVLGDDPARTSPDQQPVPIASLAKVMTAYLVLQAAPLSGGGFRLTVRPRDVADTRARAARDESLVAVAVGETLTERQALAALLLPSANNVAIMLARKVAGSVAAFVRRMNRTAQALGMHDTRYTDPSGYDQGTQSTAADQVVLAQVAMRNHTFASLVAKRSYRLPVAGTVHNTDRLLGQHGFVGIKTGSDDAAGGCFMFRTHRPAGDLTGVILGQPGHNLIMTGQYAAVQLAEQVAPERVAR
jgi:D-alanyl-D-alanine carboxypeptidase (penicillin-binding protein 5/6)